HSMRERELGWHIIYFNIKKNIVLSDSKIIQTFLFFQVRIYFIPDNTYNSKALYIDIYRVLKWY
ncbi:MAG: hypothetical protein ABIH37_05460, partial [archaeon]